MIEPGDKVWVTTRDGVFARAQWLVYDGEEWKGGCGRGYTPKFMGRILERYSADPLTMDIFHMAEALIAEGEMVI